MADDFPAIDRIPIGRSVTYAVRGVPEIGDEYNAARTIAPTEITLNYRAVSDSQLGRVSVYVKGWWMQDGKRVPMDKPVGRWLYGDPDHWPAWLAEEARLHDPDAETQAHPPQHAWRVETRDPLAGQWAPGSHFAHRPAAVKRWETANRTAPLWRDGTPVERRIVRETTTYTVEAEHTPEEADGA